MAATRIIKGGVSLWCG